MAGESIDDDEYVARLLKKDAVDASKKYDLVGMNAFYPKRPRADAPKPNTNFLRHIIRQTDSHNAALLAREARDSRARLRQLDTPNEDADDRGSKRRRKLHSPDWDDHVTRHARRERHHVSSETDQDRRSRKRSRHEQHVSKEKDENKGHRRRHGTERLERPEHRSSHRRQSEHYSRRITDEAHASRHQERSSREHAKQRPVSRPRMDTRSMSPDSKRPHTSSKHDRRPRSPRRRSRSPGKPDEGRKRASEALARQSPTPEDESDPLEAIVGPLPPAHQPAVRSRGRGAHNSSADGINARFSSTYNPRMDNEPLSDVGDQWGDAVEAYRDRQRWKQQGAERLKAAGFSEDQLRKWERGEEKNDEDVRWTARGQAREWDRGKVVDADGDVGHKAAWAEE